MIFSISWLTLVGLAEELFSSEIERKFSFPDEQINRREAEGLLIHLVVVIKQNIIILNDSYTHNGMILFVLREQALVQTDLMKSI